MTLGEKLRALREKRGWTQSQAAENLGVSSQVISNYERDYRSPDKETLSKISGIYNCSIDWLLGISDDDAKIHVDDEWSDILSDPEVHMFFKDFKGAPEERKQEMLRFWRLIKEAEMGRKLGDKQGE